MSKLLVDEIGGNAAADTTIASGKKIAGTASQFKMTDVVQGDVLYGSAADTINRLAKGTAAQVLSMNSGATAPEWAASAAGGKVLQVLQAKKTDTSTSTSTSFVDISDLSQAITPASASSKFLVTMSLQGNGTPAVNYMLAQIVRDSTSIAIGDTAGSRVRATSGGVLMAILGGAECVTVSWIDEPATASAVTYKVQCAANDVGTFYINRTSGDTDSANFSRYVSTLTVMEIGA